MTEYQIQGSAETPDKRVGVITSIINARWPSQEKVQRRKKKCALFFQLGTECSMSITLGNHFGKLTISHHTEYTHSLRHNNPTLGNISTRNT